jgi:hypothetical protein
LLCLCRYANDRCELPALSYWAGAWDDITAGAGPVFYLSGRNDLTRSVIENVQIDVWLRHGDKGGIRIAKKLSGAGPTELRSNESTLTSSRTVSLPLFACRMDVRRTVTETLEEVDTTLYAMNRSRSTISHVQVVVVPTS